MAFVKIVGGVVVQKQQDAGPGFIEVADTVVCGMLFDGTTFTNPPPTPISAGDQRIKDFLADPSTVTFVDLLDNKTLAQIDAYIDNHNTLAKMQALCKLILRAAVIGQRRQ